MTRLLAAHHYRSAVLVLTFGTMLLTAPTGHAWPQDQKMSGMAGMSTDPSGHPCDDMGSSWMA